jgi:conjugal transfer pilus assembly protein TraE
MVLNNNIEFLRFQRNIFAALAVILSLTLLTGSTFLFSKRERVIITPAVVEKAFWVDQSQVSPTYTEQFGVFLGQLLLTKSPESAQKQREVILRHTSPGFSPLLRAKLVDDEQVLIKQGASHVFFPLSIESSSNGLSVILEGDRISYSGERVVARSREKYKLGFVYSGGRLLLNGIEGHD